MVVMLGTPNNLTFMNPCIVVQLWK